MIREEFQTAYERVRVNSELSERRLFRVIECMKNETQAPNARTREDTQDAHYEMRIPVLASEEGFQRMVKTRSEVPWCTACAKPLSGKEPTENPW